MLYSQICHFLGRTDIEYRKKHINIKLWCIKSLFVDKKGITCFQCVKKPVKNKKPKSVKTTKKVTKKQNGKEIAVRTEEKTLDIKTVIDLDDGDIKRKLVKNSLPQIGLLDQEILSKMAYESKLGTKFSDKKKDALVRKFNRRIVRNYILSAILGGLVVGGIMNAPKVKAKLQTVIEKNFEQGR